MDVKKKSKNELRKARVTASDEYKDWRKTRSIHKPTFIGISYQLIQESNTEVASLTSQL